MKLRRKRQIHRCIRCEREDRAIDPHPNNPMSVYCGHCLVGIASGTISNSRATNNAN
jgi:hypothetical protein